MFRMHLFAGACSFLSYVVALQSDAGSSEDSSQPLRREAIHSPVLSSSASSQSRLERLKKVSQAFENFAMKHEEWEKFRPPCTVQNLSVAVSSPDNAPVFITLPEPQCEQITAFLTHIDMYRGWEESLAAESRAWIDGSLDFVEAYNWDSVMSVLQELEVKAFYWGGDQSSSWRFSCS